GKGATASPPGSQALLLAVHDVVKARTELVSRGATVSEVYHRSATNPRAPGPDPERSSYASLPEFKDPDGNGWLLQEVRERPPGRRSPPPRAGGPPPGARGCPPPGEEPGHDGNRREPVEPGAGHRAPRLP